MEKAVTWQDTENVALHHAREEECRSSLEHDKLRMNSGQPKRESEYRTYLGYGEKAGIVPHGHWKIGIMRFVMKVPQQKQQI